MKQFGIIAVGILVVSFPLSACQADFRNSVGASALQPKSGTPISLKQNENLDNLSRRRDDPSRIFDFIANSDLVVIAQAVKAEPIARINKTETNPNVINMGDRVAGIVHSFNVQEFLFSADLLRSRENPKHLRTFQIFVPIGDMEEAYQNGHEYLIFLKRIPTEEKLSAIYELNPAQIYFRAYTGRRSIFPTYVGDMHGPSKKGIVATADGKNEELITAIKELCQAIRPRSVESKIRGLEKLTTSSDQNLRDYALAAISYLKDTKPDQK